MGKSLKDQLSELDGDTPPAPAATEPKTVETTGEEVDDEEAELLAKLLAKKKAKEAKAKKDAVAKAAATRKANAAKTAKPDANDASVKVDSKSKAEAIVAIIGMAEAVGMTVSVTVQG